MRIPTLARSLSLGLVLVVVVVGTADARQRHHSSTEPVARDRHDPVSDRVQEVATATAVRSPRQFRRRASLTARRGTAVGVGFADVLRRQLRQQAAEIEKMRQELAEIRNELRPDQSAATPLLSRSDNNAVASLGPDMPLPDAGLQPSSRVVHVFPATAVQRGQFRDRRRSHLHAGIDLGGELGSPIVASFGGIVLPAPGRDRGYGPHVIVIKGNDGIVYRYAHLASVTVKVGQHVAAGQHIGAMGKVGPFGYPHLHFEMMKVAEYRRRPYGVHSLDPNDYLGGERGRRMVAGVAMAGQAAHRYAATR